MKKIFDVLNVVKQKLFVKKDKIHSEKYYRRIDFLNEYSLLFHAIFLQRKRFPEQIKQYIYGDDTSFWSRSYFIATTGGVSLETVKQYIESQRSEEHQAKKNQQFQKKTLFE